MKPDEITRRGFLKTSTAAVTAATLLSSGFLNSPARGVGNEPATKPSADGAKSRTATDRVALGKTGIMLSRVGIGTGSNNGHTQTADGQEAFNTLIQYCFDQGITYIDTAEAYATFGWIADAIKGLPREKLFIQSKIDGRPADILAKIDHHRSVFKTDYVDSMLVHCMTHANWTDDWKRILEGFDQAKEKQWIRAKGVSCHSFPALQAANQIDWTEVHLVRVNPQGVFMDGQVAEWKANPQSIPTAPVLAEIKAMHDKGRGVIGMKICGNGTFTDFADREKSIRFAMANPNIDAIVIGMKNRQEVDENLRVINKALAEV